MRGDKNYDDTRAAIINDSFNVDSLDNATMLRLKLPKYPGIILNKSKVDSLAKKLFSSLSKYLAYYPKVTGQLKKSEERALLPGSAGSKKKHALSEASAGRSTQKLG